MLKGLAVMALYMLGCFLLSAAIVRIFPKARASDWIRSNLGLAFVLPALLAFALLAGSFELFDKGFSGLRRGFELLSGRKLKSRRSAYYGRASYGRRAGHRS